MLATIIILRSTFVGQDPEKSSQMCQDFPSFYTRPLEAKTPVNGDTILPSLHLPGELSSLYTYVFILCLLIALKATKTLKWLLYFGVLKSLFSHHPLPAGLPSILLLHKLSSYHCLKTPQLQFRNW